MPTINAPSRGRRPRHASRRREQGSAYLFVLFLLVLLTVLGLSLALVTQTEAQIGASEKMATRNFFTADSGIAYSLARKQVTNAEDAKVLNALDTATSGIPNLNLANRIDLSPLATMTEPPCHLCSINDRQGDEYKAIEYVLNVTAARWARLGADSTTDSTLALKQLSMIVVRQPATSSIGALMELNGDDTLRKSLRY